MTSSWRVKTNRWKIMIHQPILIKQYRRPVPGRWWGPTAGRQRPLPGKSGGPLPACQWQKTVSGSEEAHYSLQETSTWKVIKTPVAARARTIANSSREVTSESRCEDIVWNTLSVGFHTILNNIIAKRTTKQLHFGPFCYKKIVKRGYSADPKFVQHFRAQCWRLSTKLPC